jgi:nicotinamide mononucleotide transporter
MIEWINNHSIEITGAALSFVYLILEIRQKWTLWLAGIVSSAFYVYIFFDAKLYAEMGMNLYYVAMSVYGLYCWKLSKTNEEGQKNFHNMTAKTAVFLGVTCLILMGLLIFILVAYTDSPVPIPDALIAAFSIVATWMVAKKMVECWYLWIFVNSFSIGLYIYQKLYPTAVLFVFYSLLSVVGLIEWRKSITKKDDSLTTKF